MKNMKLSRSEFISIRGARTHVRHWGREGAPMVFMVHGWMDVAASFQFVVDELQGDWHVIAPDWRGFGLSDYTLSDTYWFPDYLADLDAMLLHYSPDAPVNLLGHSMGANVAGLYAGVRPERISRFINLEGFGMMATQPQQAPGRYAKWLAELREPPVMRSYPTQKAVAERLQKTNPRLPDARAAFLAEHWSAQNEAGECGRIDHRGADERVFLEAERDLFLIHVDRDQRLFALHQVGHRDRPGAGENPA